MTCAAHHTAHVTLWLRRGEEQRRLLWPGVILLLVLRWARSLKHSSAPNADARSCVSALWIGAVGRAVLFADGVEEKAHGRAE